MIDFEVFEKCRSDLAEVLIVGSRLLRLACDLLRSSIRMNGLDDAFRSLLCLPNAYLLCGSYCT